MAAPKSSRRRRVMRGNWHRLHLRVVEPGGSFTAAASGTSAVRTGSGHAGRRCMRRRTPADVHDVISTAERAACTRVRSSMQACPDAPNAVTTRSGPAWRTAARGTRAKWTMFSARWPGTRKVQARPAQARTRKIPEKYAASSAFAVSGRTCPTYWSGRTMTMQPTVRSIPRMAKMSSPGLASAQNTFS